jgi:four helix bundle protein
VWNRCAQFFFKNNYDRIPYFHIRYSLFDIRYSFFSEFLFRFDWTLAARGCAYILTANIFFSWNGGINMGGEADKLFSFQELKVWQKSVLFAEQVIRSIDEIEAPRKHYRLIEQLESACTSVSMNIAEGKGRQTTKEFIQFLYIARGSLFEVVTLLIIFNNLRWLKTKSFEEIQNMALEITKMLNSLIKSMKKKS